MNNKSNWFYISITFISIIVLGIEKAGIFTDELRFVGFALFTIVCVAMIIGNKDSMGKRIGAILYFLLGLVVFIN